MSTEIPPQYNPKETEDKIYRLWEGSGFFNPDRLPATRKAKAANYVIVVPPPNVTGSLHLGHALNAAIQDILIRKKRMEGYKTLWLPGTDHAGIATQVVVEKELKKEGKNRYDLGREKFLERVWQWKEKYGNIILDQFKKLGSSMDWTRTRFTMDEGYQKAVEEAFIHYYKKGWIYRAERVVNWCPKDQTSLSDLELEYKEVKTILYYIRYPLVEKHKIQNLKSKIQNPGFIIVATTRPETMLGDAAVAVNPKDGRYKKFVGQKVVLPIQNREIPIIADGAVDKEFGTGAVKVTPSHDLLDAEIAERHRLPRLTVIDKFGKMTEGAGAICSGLKTGDCREKVVEELKKLGLIEKEEPYTHNVAICYRCGSIIEPIPSRQWFLKMRKLAYLAMTAVKEGKVKFHPGRWQEPYMDWLGNVRDWTISRQIWWGHRLPVFFCGRKYEENSDGGDFVVSKGTPEKCPFCKNCTMRQAEDVLDTWFSSALWPFAVFGWPEKTRDLRDFYPTSVLSTARDIINLWVSRMVFSGIEFMKKAPFKDVYIHATILTKEGKRMSKSLGTGIDPMTLIEKYGADALRFGLIWQAMGAQDIRWSEEHIIAGRKFCNKIWNSARFVMLQIPSSEFQIPQKPSARTAEDEQILKRLAAVRREVSDRIERFDFGRALHILYDFYWHEFCDIYIETAKKQMAVESLKTSTRFILAYILAVSLKLLHPFVPFVTEEIWSHLPLKNKRLLMIEQWPH